VVCRLYAGRPDLWNSALADAGLDINARRFSDEEIRAALARLWARTGRPPRATDPEAAAWAGPTAKTLRARYGGVASAWKQLAPAPPDS
jgi:hypothetical protein